MGREGSAARACSRREGGSGSARSGARWRNPGSRSRRTVAPEFASLRPGYGPRGLRLLLNTGLRHRKRYARKIEFYRADLVHRGWIDAAQVARGGDGGVATRAVEHVKAQQLLFGLGEGAVGHHAFARAAQHAGALGGLKPRRRPEASLLIEAAMDFIQINHHRRVFLRGPGSDLFFDVIGQDGVEHGFLVRVGPVDAQRTVHVTRFRHYCYVRRYLPTLR